MVLQKKIAEAVALKYEKRPSGTAAGQPLQPQGCVSMKLLKQFIQQETVLTAAAVLAVVSAFFVPPDAQYLGYIDLRTLAILFSLMTVMAGLRRQGFFDGLGRALLSRTHSTFQLTLVLVGLCFFGSMFITNDVSLLTFVPFTFVVLSRPGSEERGGHPLPDGSGPRT